MTSLDWGIVAAYFIGMMVIAWVVRRRAGRNIESFFAASRSLPWWVAAASLVATSFGAGTPMWVTGLVRRFGIQAAWQFWTYMLGVGLAVFLFSRYWRRVGIVTDLELVALRHEGAAARWYRACFAVYTSLIGVSLIIAASIRTTDTLLAGMFDLNPQQRLICIIAILGFTAIYSAMSGLLGVVLTDMAQLIVAFVGTSILAAVVVYQVGGIDSMVTQLRAMEDWPGHTLNFAPQMGGLHHTPPGALPLWNAIGFIGILWWAVTVCSGYIAQRLLSTKNEAHASKAMLGYGIVYWGINAWPWIVVAITSLILISAADLSASQEDAYVQMIRRYAPDGLRGVMFIALLSALMSTLSTMLNWGASYFINDVYRPMIRPQASDAHYVWASRLVTLLALVAGLVVGLSINSIVAIGYITSMMGAAKCVQVLMRWLWGRMNAWGEIAGICTIVIATLAISQFEVLDGLAARWIPLYNAQGELLEFHNSFEYFGLRAAIVMALTIAAVYVASKLTPAPSEAVVRRFVLRARPLKLGWRPMLRKYGIDYRSDDHSLGVLAGWLSVTACIVSVLFGIGKLILGQPMQGLAWLAGFGLSLGLALLLINRMADGAEDDVAPNAVAAPEPIPATSTSSDSK